MNKTLWFSIVKKTVNKKLLIVVVVKINVYPSIYLPDLLTPKLNALRRKCIDEVRRKFSNMGSRTTLPTIENSLPVGQ